MAAYPIPNPQYGIYNQNNFTKNPTGQDGLTLDTAKLYFLQFPNAQTTQTEYLHDIGVSGTATIIGNALFETGTFQDVLTCEKGIDISTSPYGITFSDNTTQITAFIEANYAQLNTDNIFLQPYKNTFQQNSSTTSTTAPLQITNSTNNDNATFYIDPAPSVDLTLYSNQTNGGLTVRNPTASFTLNPVTIQTGVVGARSLNPIDMNANTLYGLNNVYSSGSNISLIDSAGDAMLQLTTSGNTCYKDLNLDLNDITNVTAITASQLTVTNIYNNGGTYVAFQSDIKLNNNNILQIGANSTATTQPAGTNNTTLATTAFVQANQPGTSNFAKLTTTTPQTFTGSNNFTGGLQVSGVNVANVNNLQYMIDSVISNETSTINHITLNSGFNQKSIDNPSSNTGAFYSFPFVFTVNNYVAALDTLAIIEFDVNPLPLWPPLIQTGQIAGTNNNMVNFFPFTWSTSVNSKACIILDMAYNVGVGSVVTMNFASLGLIQV
jgi:hypothetical protein